MLGDVRHYARLLRLFRIKHAGDSEEIRRLLRLDDLLGVRQAAHTPKGASGTLGLKELQRLSGRLEQAAAASEAEPVVTARANELFQELDRAMAALTQVLHRIAETETPRIENSAPPQMGELLGRLDAMLAQNGASALVFFEAFKDDLDCAYGDAIRDLELLIQNFDFSDARQALHKLMK